jgi:polyhydroxyalkanoate synthesis regulator phasin
VGLLDDITKNKLLTGLAIGVGASILLPKLLPVLEEAAKPLAKGLMKSGLLFYEKGKEVVAEISETTEDLWAEVKMEVEADQLAELKDEITEAEVTISDAKT